MKSQQENTSGTDDQPLDEMAEAIRAWHRGESLTEKQIELVDQARRESLARAHGVDL